jgi:hypothetical protein
VSLQNLEAQARRDENRDRRILRRLIGGQSSSGSMTVMAGCGFPAGVFELSARKLIQEK